MNTRDITQQNITNIVIQGNTSQVKLLRAPYREAFKSLIENRLTLFGGRNTALAQIAKFINKATGGYLVITAPAGFGKTSLMAKLVSEASETFAYHFFAPYENPNSVTEEGFLRNVVEQMAHWHGCTDTFPEKLPDLDARYNCLLNKSLEHTHVLVIDGLDEVTNWKIARYLSRRLPDNLHIIVTVRDVAQDLAVNYDFPNEQTEYLQLGGLTRDDVAQVMWKAGKGATVFADNPILLKEVMRVSAYQEEPTLGADPFYVRWLAEDAADGRLTPANIATQPKGLNKYLSAWWREIEESEEDNEPLEDLF
ncbi:MAG: NACHT domain-containing protein, partial [Microcystaceae cyanobacterium]